MWGLILLAIIVGGLFHFLHTFTGNDEVDGLFSVLLGLYICSKPATHIVDLMILGATFVIGFRRSVEYLVGDAQLAGDVQRIESHHDGNDAVFPRRLINSIRCIID